MESEDLFSDEILDWLQDYDDEISADIELLLARASDVYESSIDSAPQPGSSPPCTRALRSVYQLLPLNQPVCTSKN